MFELETARHRKYCTRQKAMAEISEDIKVFYHRQRRYAGLDNLSPAAYWKKFIKRQNLPIPIWCPQLRIALPFV